MGLGISPVGAVPFGSTLLVGGIFYVGNWRPKLGEMIERLDHVEFDVLDRNATTSIPFVHNVRVRAIQNGVVETVWTEEGFTPRFYRGSGRVKITGGYHFILRRTGGWISHMMVIDVTAIDDNGNVVRGSSAAV